jgi:hypothetical protein
MNKLLETVGGLLLLLLLISPLLVAFAVLT